MIIKTNQVNPHQFVAIKADSFHKTVILMPCYQTIKRISELFFNEINRLSNKYKYNPTWISGELNLPYTN